MTPDEFWAWLVAHDDGLRWPPNPNFVEAIGDRLHAIHPSLAFELAKAEPPLLSISAAGDRSLFELVHRIVSCAPASLAVHVVAFRQRGPVAGVALKLPNGGTLSSNDIWFRVERSDDSEADLGLHVFVRDFPAENQGAWQEATYLLLDNALGEEDVVTKIAWIEWAPLPHEPARRGLRPLADLPPTFDSMLGRPAAS
jgi:hypothetical protein